jgi:hypothetical protein
MQHVIIKGKHCFICDDVEEYNSIIGSAKAWGQGRSRASANYYYYLWEFWGKIRDLCEEDYDNLPNKST